MNDLALVNESSKGLSINNIITDESLFNRLLAISDMMTSGLTTVPKHIRENRGDCMAIAIQAAQWEMSPFTVAQKTHLVNGTLGYEAQLVNAVATSSGAIKGRFHYEYKGEGNDLSCRVGAIITGETSIQWGEWLSLSSVTIKNSPLWKTNPKVQFGYLQVKNFCRQYCPGAIMGVYSVDELEDIRPEKEANPLPEQEFKQSEAEKEVDKPSVAIEFCTQEYFSEMESKWTDLIRSGKQSPDSLMSALSKRKSVPGKSDFIFTGEQKFILKSIEVENEA